jgi:altronate hydrolase
MTLAPSLIRLHPDDDVAVARHGLSAGDQIADGVVAATDVPAGHKIALHAIGEGEPVIKYGQPIGLAARAITAGEHVHASELCVPGGLSQAEPGSALDLSPWLGAPTFDGYVRDDGRVGTRNYVGILTTVNCSATVAKQVALRAQAELADYPGVDGVVALTHTTGCGIASEGEGIDNLRRTLAGFAGHPNFAGVLLIGLGCEANQTDRLLDTQGLTIGPHLRTLGIQEAGGTLAAIERGVEEVRALMTLAAETPRTPQPASCLTLALQCGGSDAWSGVTANPSLGHAADLLVRAGGTVILAETPEIYGAESLLLRRAESREVAEALLERLRWWEDYVARSGQQLNNNPSPGNLEGGLSTILEKSLGAVAKSGTSPLRGVYRYAERVDRTGFVFMDSPGYDPCSVTGEIASGANLVCFTTGRGSVFGAKPVPSLKLASNDELAASMEPDIDLSAGGVAHGRETTQEVGRRLFDLMIETASGQPSKSETLGFGEMEFVPWQIGATV